MQIEGWFGRMGALLHVSHIQRGRLRGVLSVDIKDIGTVEQLKNVISTQHELPCTDLTLFFRGVNLDNHNQLSLEHLIPDLQQIGPPRFSVRSTVQGAESGHLSLFVVMTDLGDRKFQVHLPAGSSVADLEQAICEHEGGLHPSMFALILNGRRLYHHLKLAYYNLVSGTSVYCMWHLRGGGGPATVDFVDMENTSALKTVKVVYRTLPSWKRIRLGLNMKGQCQNRRCEAFGSKHVFCQVGFTIYNVAQAVHDCPACKGRIKATTCGFSGCQWMFEGRKVMPDGSSVDIVSSWRVTNGDDFQWFDEAGGRNMAEWSHLVITVKKLDHGAGKYRCSACFGKLRWNSSSAVEDQIVDTACGHGVHADCAAVLRRRGYTSCPTCRSPFPRF